MPSAGIHRMYLQSNHISNLNQKKIWLFVHWIPYGLSFSLHLLPPFPRLFQVMGLIPHVFFYISYLLPRVLNYGWNLPDKAQSYISLPLSSHLDPSGFIILCEDHLAVSKPCPAAWELTLIFIRETFWREGILGKRANRWVEKDRWTHTHTICVCVCSCVRAWTLCRRLWTVWAKGSESWHIEDTQPSVSGNVEELFLVLFCGGES